MELVLHYFRKWHARIPVSFGRSFAFEMCVCVCEWVGFFSSISQRKLAGVMTIPSESSIGRYEKIKLSRRIENLQCFWDSINAGETLELNKKKSRHTHTHETVCWRNAFTQPQQGIIHFPCAQRTYISKSIQLLIIIGFGYCAHHRVSYRYYYIILWRSLARTNQPIELSSALHSPISSVAHSSVNYNWIRDQVYTLKTHSVYIPSSCYRLYGWLSLSAVRSTREKNNNFEWIGLFWNHLSGWICHIKIRALLKMEKSS